MGGYVPGLVMHCKTVPNYTALTCVKEVIPVFIAIAAIGFGIMLIVRYAPYFNLKD